MKAIGPVAQYLDILLAWRLWNFRSIAHSTMQYSMMVVMRDIRGLPFAALAEFNKGENRSLLYRQIAERIWNPADLLKGVSA